MKAPFSFGNVQVIVSPAWRDIEAGAPSVHVAVSRSQPAGGGSLPSYVPGAGAPGAGVCPSVRKKFATQLGLNSNDWGSPSGSVCLTTLMKASFSFVKVQVTVSPALRTTSTVSPDCWLQVDPEPPVTVQVTPSKSQPEGRISSTV